MNSPNSNIEIKRKPDVSVLHTDEECEDMIKEWLKKNKPSKRFKDEKLPTHITPESNLGRGLIYD